ncbi:MAG: complex I NDUFA9 subunit family protein [Candidatus Sumerlaeia bacterium]|nr:complex I NDUFA9 subunit family protein [Candidatus Sumerlaeia bacterium]
MNVFLTGATGFVGTELLRQLIQHHHVVTCLVRAESEPRLSPLLQAASGNVKAVVGDCLNLSSFLEAMRGCQAVIHLVGIIRENPERGVTFEQLHVEATRNVVRAAVQTGVGRFLHMSALGAQASASSRYHQTKYQAEQLVLQSGLKYVIFRPSIIFGPHDQFVNVLSGMVRRFMPAPVLGDGRVRFQPIAVENVAEGFVRALTPPGCLNRIYEVGGPHSLSMNEMYDAIARAKGFRRAWKIHIPLHWVERWLPTIQRFRPDLPLTPETLRMLQEDNVCDPREFLRTFAIEPIELEQGLARYLRR